MLDLCGVSRSFGGVFAVRGVTLSVAAGELCGVIGPNGAGKSTLFALVSGHLRAERGTIRYQDRDIGRWSPHRRAREGIAIAFQGARLFGGMTALENVMVGAHTWTRHGLVASALRLPRHRNEERMIHAEALSALARVGLADRARTPAESLPLGQQRALQVARALCARPRLLLLDEPAAGLRAAERESLARLLGELHDQGVTMMLIEHDVGFVTGLADRIVALDLGQVIAAGPPAQVVGDPQVVTAYLGGSVENA